MNVTSSLHIAENVVLQFWHRLQGIRSILILLDVANDLGSLGSLGEIDQVGLLDDGGYAILNEGQIREIYTCDSLSVEGQESMEEMRLSAIDVPKNGMQGGFEACRVSLYSPKFFVLAMSFLMTSSVVLVRAGTWSQVRFRRAIGAVPRADIIDVSVEKLFSVRHF